MPENMRRLNLLIFACGAIAFTSAAVLLVFDYHATTVVELTPALKTASFLLCLAFVASLLVIPFASRHSGKAQKVASGLVVLGIVALLSITAVMGRLSGIVEADAPGARTDARIAALSAEASRLQKSVDTLIEYDRVSKSLPLQDRIGQLNDEIARLQASKPVTTSEASAAFATFINAIVSRLGFEDEIPPAYAYSALMATLVGLLAVLETFMSHLTAHLWRRRERIIHANGGQLPEPPRGTRKPRTRTRSFLDAIAERAREITKEVQGAQVHLKASTGAGSRTYAGTPGTGTGTPPGTGTGTPGTPPPRPLTGTPKNVVAFPGGTHAGTPKTDRRKDDLRERIQRKEVRPSNRALKALGMGSDTAKRYLEEFVAEGLLVKKGTGYELAGEKTRKAR